MLAHFHTYTVKQHKLCVVAMDTRLGALHQDHWVVCMTVWACSMDLHILAMIDRYIYMDREIEFQ